MVNSRFTVTEVQQFLGVPAERQTVTYLGVEREVFGPDGDASVLPDGRPYVLFAGTLEPFKNFATLLAAHVRAFPRAEVALVTAGSGPPPDERVHALGVVAPAELARWYRGARAVAVPSYYECFGLPLLEAMSCGVPVLASRLASLEEVGGDACIWIDDPLDVDAWSAVLTRAVDDGEWRARFACRRARASGDVFVGPLRRGNLGGLASNGRRVKFKRVYAAAAIVFAFATAGGRPAAASTDVSLLDLVETEYGYTTIADQYQHPVSAQRLLDGARVGLVAYLYSRGITEPQVAMMHARADGRGAVPAISQQIGLAIQRYGSRVDTLSLVYAAIRGEVAALQDPYSVFFTAADVKGFSAAIDGYGVRRHRRSARVRRCAQVVAGGYCFRGQSGGARRPLAG